jgi:vitamin B12 transporter
VFNTYRDSLNWQNDLTLDERNSLILGGDWYEDRINSSTDFNEDSRWNRAAFIQHRYQADSFSTELGCATTTISSSAARTAGAAPSRCR